MARTILIATLLSCLGAGLHAQTQNSSASTPAAGAGLTTLSLPAVAYGSRGDTNLLFQGTPLMPRAAGFAKVEKQGNNIRVAATFTGLQNPTVFGHEYLTYVLWAVTPDGRVFNFNEIALPRDRDAFTTQSPENRATLTIVTAIQTFGLMVTAEPYFSVKSPSRVVVLQNTFAEGARPLQATDVTYDVTRSGGYVPTGFRFDPVLLRSNLPLDFFQARNAMRVAQSAGAEEHAAAIYANASTQMRRISASAMPG